MRRRLQQQLEELLARCEEEPAGAVEHYYASGRGYYPPSQARAERERFGICVTTVDGETFAAGDADVTFPLQSLSKVFTYALALADHGRERVLQHVGVEPSGEAFNAIRFDERHNRPFNPMVNAGALATSALVDGIDHEERLARILETLRAFAGREDLAVDPEVFDAELATDDHNRAIAYLMRSLGMLRGGVESVLSLYLMQCSVAVSCRDLAMMGATLANGYANPRTGQQVLPQRRVRDVLSVMHTCGMYNYAGQWAVEVGVPAKSGVSGGIVAAIPGKMGIGAYSPGLDAFGNSVRGIQVLEDLSERLGLHVFATEEEDTMLAPLASSGAGSSG